MCSNINNCHNVKDFRNLAKKRLPSPIFHYIDGAADDEITYKRNTDAYDQCDFCLLYTSPSPRDRTRSRMPSSA